MALTLSGKVNTLVQLSMTAPLDLSVPLDPLKLNRTRTITTGTGADQADVVWHSHRTLTNGATEALSLHGGTLADVYGAVVFDKVKGLAVLNYSTTNHLDLGGSGATALRLFTATTGILALPAATSITKPTVFLLEAPAADGIDVTTNDTLKVAHGGDTTNSITYDIVLWGEA
jgi:hypothetical protein